MEKQKSIHELMIEKIEKFKTTIEKGNSSNGSKLVKIKSEKGLLEIINYYAGDVSEMSELTIKRLIGAFESCKEVSFWHSNLKPEIDKTVQNLKSYL